MILTLLCLQANTALEVALLVTALLVTTVCQAWTSPTRTTHMPLMVSSVPTDTTVQQVKFTHLNKTEN